MSSKVTRERLATVENGRATSDVSVHFISASVTGVYEETGGGGSAGGVCVCVCVCVPLLHFLDLSSYEWEKCELV